MYDENEQLHNIENALNNSFRYGKEVFALGKQIYEHFSGKAKENLDNLNAQGFVFTGKPTDLCYFKSNKILSRGVLDSIDDFKVKNAVIDNLIQYEKMGYIDVDVENGTISITPKGQEYINSKEFQKAAIADQTEAQKNPALYEQSFGVELDGTHADFNVYRFTDNLNLNEIILNPNKELAQKICDNVGKWQEKGLVKISENGLAKITDEGRKMLNSSAFKVAAGKSVEKAVSAVPAAGQVVAVTKKVLSVSKDFIANISKVEKGQTR